MRSPAAEKLIARRGVEGCRERGSRLRPEVGTMTSGRTKGIGRISADRPPISAALLDSEPSKKIPAEVSI